MASPVANQKTRAMVLTQEMRRILGLQVPQTSSFDAIDWELCNDIEICAKKAKAAKKEKSDQNDSRPLKRGRLLTPDSEDEDEDEGNNGTVRHARKKQKTAIDESDIMAMIAEIASPTSSSLSYIAEEEASPSSMDMPFIFSALDSFAGLSIEPFEDFAVGGARLSHIQRREKERQHFTIWEDEDEQDSCSQGFPLTTLLATYPDEDKENEPPEYDMTADDEFAATEYDAFYYSVEQAQQQYREALSEIQN